MRRYLLVDDNRDFADNLAEILRDRGDEAEVASSGTEALLRIRRLRFDALLTDMRMPLMGGAQVLREIRAVDPGLPAVVVTAHAADADLEAVRREGLLAVLAKPVPVERLVALLGIARRDGLVAVVQDGGAPGEDLAEALRSRGFAAVAASLPEARRLGPARPFCALVDLRRPGAADGEAARRLASLPPGLPVLVVAARDGAAPPFPHAGLFPEPLDAGALLGAVERLHAARSPEP